MASLSSSASQQHGAPPPRPAFLFHPPCPSSRFLARRLCGEVLSCLESAEPRGQPLEVPLPNVDAALLARVLDFCERRALDENQTGIRLATEAETMKRLGVEAEAAVAAAAELEGRLAAVAAQLAQEAEAARRRAEEAEGRRVDAADRTARLAQLSAEANKRAEEADAALKQRAADKCGAGAAWEERSIASMDVELLLETISVRAPPAKTCHRLALYWRAESMPGARHCVRRQRIT